MCKINYFLALEINPELETYLFENFDFRNFENFLFQMTCESLDRTPSYFFADQMITKLFYYNSQLT